MSVDILGMTNRRIEIEDIQNFIAATYDKKAEVKKAASFGGRANGSGTVFFSYTSRDLSKVENRILWVWQISSKKDLKIFNREHPEIPERTEEFTYLSLGCWGHGEEIVQSVLAHFGGGILVPQDCDPENWEEISSNAPEHRYKAVWDMKNNKMDIIELEDLQEQTVVEEPVFIVRPNELFCSGVFTAREGDNLFQKGKMLFTNFLKSETKVWIERLSKVQLGEGL